MKKVLALSLALVMVLTLAACGNNPAPANNDQPSSENPSNGGENISDGDENPSDGNDIMPSDAEIAEAYNSAREALGWFYMSSMPAVDYDFNVESGLFTYDGGESERGPKVNHPTIKTLADLENYLQTLFTDEFVEELLSRDQYFDQGGELHTTDGARGSDITKGEETYEIIKDNELKIIYRVTVEDTDAEYPNPTVIGHTVHDMVYEKIGDKWIFTSFELVR
ncbi:MAG: hypothetical protein FWH20_01715 [Oscillospiraceae bacterium]|nr:hypothetical protein [Oscillospiraceae bacterium]